MPAEGRHDPAVIRCLPMSATPRSLEHGLHLLVPQASGLGRLRAGPTNLRTRKVVAAETRDDAVALLQKRHGEIVAGTLLGPDAQRTTFDDLVNLIEQDYAANARRS